MIKATPFNFSLTKLMLATIIGLALLPLQVLAAGLMPFLVGNAPTASNVQEASSQIESSLKANGFEVVGQYAPTSEKKILVVTNAQLKKLAAQSKNGGFGAMERVAITSSSGKLSVSYTNPTYMWNAYRMKGDIAPIQASMEKALGNQGAFGADKGLSASDLRDYQYKMMMPYFDDEDALADYGSYSEAVAAVEAGLKAKRAQTSKVYRIDIPGTEMTVFGVALNHAEAADKFISKKIDKKGASHAAHFPYEILVNGSEVMALNGKFRIAINWPSLSMMGSGSFMSIAGAPDHIAEALKAVAKNKAIEKESEGLL